MVCAAKRQLEECQEQLAALQRQHDALLSTRSTSQPAPERNIWDDADAASAAAHQEADAASAASPAASDRSHSEAGADASARRGGSIAGLLRAHTRHRSFVEMQLEGLGGGGAAGGGGGEEAAGLRVQLARTQAHAQRCESAHPYALDATRPQALWCIDSARV
jgi:hypothetical protein